MNRTSIGIIICILFFLLLFVSSFTDLSKANSSTAVYVCTGVKNYYSLHLRKKTDKLVFGARGGIYYEPLSYSIILSTSPRVKQIYNLSDIIFDYHDCDTPTDNIRFISGIITVDINKLVTHVNLMTSNGEFEGNGDYPLTVLNF